MAQIEKQAFADGASGTDFMLKAGQGLADYLEEFIEAYELQKRILLVAGKGNNAGDGYVALNILSQKGYHCQVFQVANFEEVSPLCAHHGQLFHQSKSITFIKDPEKLDFPEEGVILDGLLGTGFQGKLEGIFLTLVNKMNASCLPIVSIDIPSGLNGNTGEVLSEAVRAHLTVFLGQPKLGFFLGEGWNHVGMLKQVDFGLDSRYIKSSSSPYHMLTRDTLSRLLPPLKRTQHKYEAGFIVALAGSSGMSGAAALTTEAALRAGAGIVHLYHPEGLELEFLNHIPEVVNKTYSKDLQPLLEAMNKASGVLIGPGLGQSKEAKKCLETVLEFIHKPLVLDADALNLIAAHKLSIPKHSILTPHIGEFSRILGKDLKTVSNLERLSLAQDYAKKHNIVLVLKGAPTWIFDGDQAYVSPPGDPGMATAGSGDVLTGILAALLGKGLSVIEAAQLGVYLHGIAGSFAAIEKTSYSLIASDIIEHLPEALEHIIGY